MSDRPQARPGTRSIVVTAISSVYMISLSVWAGGLVVLGTVVAPTVFGMVPAPASADAMTVVFRKFDVVTIACAAFALVSETALAWRGGRTSRLDLVRGGAILVASGLAMTVGTWLSPAIQHLHQEGAVRGYGEAGLALERLHRHAELAAKAELFLVLFVIVLLVTRVARPASRS